jgi:hypothetical protein
LRKWILDHPKESDLIEQLSKQYIMWIMSERDRRGQALLFAVIPNHRGQSNIRCYISFQMLQNLNQHSKKQGLPPSVFLGRGSQTSDTTCTGFSEGHRSVCNYHEPSSSWNTSDDATSNTNCKYRSSVCEWIRIPDWVATGQYSRSCGIDLCKPGSIIQYCK